MEKDKLPPSSSRYYPMKPETSASSSSSSSQVLEDSTNRFSQDISRMPDFPTRNVGHRRAQSEILSLPDDLTFDNDLGMVGSGDGPSFSDETEEDFLAMYLDMDKFGANLGAELMGSESSGGALGGAQFGGGVASSSLQIEGLGQGSSERPRVRHHHSQSMDGSTTIKAEQLLGSSSDGPSSFADSKKAMSAAKLADLAIVDPKRAKRIWANRQSAARSKERKMRYIAELERKVQTLQTEATTLSAQLAMLQRDTNGLTAENSELKLRVQAMEQQVHLQDALNDALREEVQRLKMATGQVMPNGPMMNYGHGQPSFGGGGGGNQQQFYHHNQMQSLLAAQQMQQLQIHHPQHQHQQQQQQMHPHQHQQQQQQQQMHTHQHQQQQTPSDLRMKAAAAAAQNQRESAADSSNAPME